MSPIRVAIVSALMVGIAGAWTAGHPVFGQGRGTTIIEDTLVVVPVPVSVTDDDGRFVTGLKKEDFDLLEDGMPQEISTFSHDQAPVTSILLIDTSGSMTSQMPQVKTAARRCATSTHWRRQIARRSFSSTRRSFHSRTSRPIA